MEPPHVARPTLESSGGALINLGSEAPEAALPLQGMYSVSKHAVKGFTEALRIEQEHVDGVAISVTLIQSTAVDTPCPENARNHLDSERSCRRRCWARDGRPRDPHGRDEGRARRQVGAMSEMDTPMSALPPDRAAARQERRPARDEQARRAEGASYAAGDSGRVQGRGDANG
ncbi:SDR family NAD(P)-dependent oxidoreductase [Coralloluteibacterium stylophorae]|uniref:SDR family NAD(P)-dependent oxidoreductase n=1 Tax=Coralloluteibacterium stylophorae TaxID=1776034 RepID=UPI001FEA1A5A|nr:SDR family NAD(P)-dependent oxidoreductase [Coralloluteibacterium stylophorae]